MKIGELPLPSAIRLIDFDFENDRELLEIVELASAVTKSPYALISFLDDGSHCLKVKKGITRSVFPPDFSFSIYGVEGNELMIVPDALLDTRFVSHPLVTGPPGIRFFAGMPLYTKEGEKFGTLCVLDTVPHTLDDHQKLILKILGNQVMKVVELRAERELLAINQRELAEQKLVNQDADIRLRSFFESSINFHVLLGKGGEVIDFNKTAYGFVRMVHKAAMKKGDQFIKYIHPDFVATFLTQYHLALKGEKSFKEGSTNYDDVGVIWWEAAFEPARNSDNEVIGISYLIRNVTERKIKEQKIISQNQSLLKIAHIQAHEFRAPLTTIMGLMSLIKEENYEAPSEYLQLLEQAVEALDTTIRHVVKNIDETVINDYTSDLTRA